MKTSSSNKDKTKNQLPQLSVIIPVKNEEETITKVIQTALKISTRTEVITVCNGTTDQSSRLAKKAGATVIEIEEAVGHDVGRSIGAFHAKGEILLFLDADFVIPTFILRKYYYRIKQGYDIVLNAYSGFKNSTSIHSTSQAKRLLNRLLQREDLQGCSLTTVPHAMTRQAVEEIGGFKELAVPPRALAKAVIKKLKITKGYYINTAHRNKKRGRGRQQEKDEVEELILGDHLEAINFLSTERGARGGWADKLRKRNFLENEQSAAIIKEQNVKEQDSRFNPLANVEHQERNLSVIISAYNEEKTIEKVIKSVQKLNPKEIILIENGSTDKTLLLCQNLGVKCITFPVPLGHDVGRAIGAQAATGEILLFVDADIVFQPQDLEPYIQACSGEIDVALNNINPFYVSSVMIDYVSMAKSLLNRTLQRADLGFSSLTAIPHALKKSAVELIGYENLAVPPKALAMAIMNQLHVQHINGVNVLKLNKKRMNNWSPGNEIEQMILGDHLEAIEWLQYIFGDRVFFRSNRCLDSLTNVAKTLES